MQAAGDAFANFETYKNMPGDGAISSPGIGPGPEDGGLLASLEGHQRCHLTPTSGNSEPFMDPAFEPADRNNYGL